MTPERERAPPLQPPGGKKQRSHTRPQKPRPLQVPSPTERRDGGGETTQEPTREMPLDSPNRPRPSEGREEGGGGGKGHPATEEVEGALINFHAWAGKRAWYPLFVHASKIPRLFTLPCHSFNKVLTHHICDRCILLSALFSELSGASFLALKTLTNVVFNKNISCQLALTRTCLQPLPFVICQNLGFVGGQKT